jgi:hypothetical protein
MFICLQTSKRAATLKMQVQLRQMDAQTVQVVCMQPIAISLYNLIRKFLYMHVPVWAFTHVEIKTNPIHNAIPSELIETKLKQIVIQCQNPNVQKMYFYKVDANLKPVKTIMKGSDIQFKQVFSSMDPVSEFGLHIDPSVEVIALQGKSDATFDAHIEGKFGTAFEYKDQCSRYAIHNASIIEEDEEQNTVSVFEYSSRGHYTNATYLFHLSLQSIQAMLTKLEIAFLD